VVDDEEREDQKGRREALGLVPDHGPWCFIWATERAVGEAKCLICWGLPRFVYVRKE
jgi:hypothetical protein